MKAILKLLLITLLLTSSFNHACLAQSIGANSWSGTLDYKDAIINFSVDFKVSHSTIEEQYISYIEIRHVVVNSISYNGVDYNQSKNDGNFSFPYKIYDGVHLNTTITESVASQNFESKTQDIHCTYKTTFTFIYDDYKSVDKSTRDRNRRLWYDKIKVDRIFVRSITGISIQNIYDDIKKTVIKKEKEIERKREFDTYITEGESFEEQNEYSKAISKYTEALNLDVDNQLANEKLENAISLRNDYENEKKELAESEKNKNGLANEAESIENDDEESYYDKKQRIEKEKSEKEYEYRQEQIEKEKEFIRRQNEEMARKEEIYEKSIKENANQLGKSVKKAMDRQHQAKMDKWDAEHRQRQAREKMLNRNKTNAGIAYSELKCFINYEVFGHEGSAKRCSPSIPVKGSKYSLNAVSSEALDKKLEYIYFTYIHMGTENDEDQNYRIKLKHTEPTKFPVDQIQHLAGSTYSMKALNLERKARKQTVTRVRSGFGVTPLRTDIDFLLFGRNKEELEAVISQIYQYSSLPVDLESNDLLSDWRVINLKRGMDLDQLIRTNSLEDQGMVYKTKDNEWVFLNDGKFIVIKNYDILNKELTKINDKNQLEIPFWQKYPLVTFATFKNMFLTTEERTLYAWLDYGFGKKGYKKVPYAFWDPNKNNLYVYKNKYIEEQYSNYKFLDIDADSYLRTGKYRPAIGYGTYSIEKFEKSSLIKFNYEGGLDWIPAIRINKLEEIEKVKAKIKLATPRGQGMDVYGDAYSVYKKGWDRSDLSTTSDDVFIYTRKPNKFRKYKITDWEIVYKYSDLYTDTDGFVDIRLAVKKSYDVFDTYFPDALRSSENYKVYSSKDMWFSSDIVPGNLHITNKDNFNSLYNFVSDIKDFIDNHNGDKAYNEQNILTSPEWKDVEIRAGKKDKSEINKSEQKKELESSPIDSKWKLQTGSNFTIKHPTKWHFKGDTKDQAQFYVMPIKDNLNIAIRLEKSPEVSNINFNNILETTGMIEALRNSIDDFILKENKTMEVDGQKFIKLYFSGQKMGVGISSETRVYIKGDFFYFLSFYAKDSLFDKYYDDAKSIMDSFVLN